MKAINNFKKYVFGLLAILSFNWAEAQMQQAEYFWDVDPGVGNGVNLTLNTINTSEADYSGDVSTAGLSAGYHILYIRAKDETSKWSLHEKRSVKIIENNNAITAAEYFFDTDPGIGNGTAIDLTPDGNSQSTFIGSLQTTGLMAGAHVVYIRAYSPGSGWSIYEKRYITIADPTSPIIAAEYFFDTDPGTGNGTPLNVVTQTGYSDLTAQIATTGLKTGYHNLYIRTQKADKSWSLYNGKYFYVKPELNKFEYYIDKDPGVGNGKELSIIPAVDQVEFTGAIKPVCLDAGVHTIFVRARDEMGVWSSVYEMQQFTQTADWMSTAMQSPGPGPFGTPVRLNTTTHATPAALEYHNLTSNSNWEADKVQLMPNIATHQFEIRDGEQCRDTVSFTTNLDPQLISTQSGTNNPNKLLDGWGKWVYLLDANNDIVAAVNDKGNDLGSVQVSHAVNSGPLRFHNAVPYHNRNFHVTTENAPQSEVGVKLYMLQPELDAVMAADANVTSAANLRIIKYDGNNEDLLLENNETETWVAFQPEWQAFNNPGQPGYVAGFNVTEFSELYFARDLAVALPVKLLNFYAKKQSGNVDLNWLVTNESGMLRYEVQRSTDCINFNTIGKVQATNETALHSYAFTDNNLPATKEICYRLRIVDADGKITYSSIIKVNLGIISQFSLNPNPVTGDMAYLVSNEPVIGNLTVDIFDLQGRKISRQFVDLSQSRIVRLSGLTAGNYVMRISGKNGETSNINFIKL